VEEREEEVEVDRALDRTVSFRRNDRGTALALEELHERRSIVEELHERRSIIGLISRDVDTMMSPMSS
jgi:hypothetical protein